MKNQRLFFPTNARFGWWLGLGLTLALALGPGGVSAHPMPNSVVLLDLHADGVAAELQLPLSELELAFGHNVNQHPETLVARLGPQLRAYLLAHVRPVGSDNRSWTVEVRHLGVQPVQQSPSGPYQELTAQLWLRPPTGTSSRTFTLHYDVVIHQLVTHIALVSIRQDWETGLYGEQPVEVGVIRLDVPSNTIPPLVINRAEGSAWRGFRTIVALGMTHIAEGTDHLMFLLVLLLPAPLLAGRKRWGGFGGVRYSVLRLVRIVTAFTVGHSVTLLAGTLGWLRLPGQPVEMGIAFSILVSAVHALRPLFPGREAYVAAGFGLVHGLAFASTLANLHLAPGRLALSLFGFNLGIELMQLLVILLTIPWLLLLSRTTLYTGVRLVGACFAAVAALGWLVQHATNQPNSFTTLVERVAVYAPWLLVALAVLTLAGFWWEERKKNPPAFRRV